jgi:SulP family sulfate permease
MLISGATGASGCCDGQPVAIHGVEYLFATDCRSDGGYPDVVGLMRWGKFIRLVASGHGRLVNGLAIVIFLAQMGQFKCSSARRQAMAWRAVTGCLARLSFDVGPRGP